MHAFDEIFSCFFHFFSLSQYDDDTERCKIVQHLEREAIKEKTEASVCMCVKTTGKKFKREEMCSSHALNTQLQSTQHITHRAILLLLLPLPQTFTRRMGVMKKIEKFCFISLPVDDIRDYKSYADRA